MVTKPLIIKGTTQLLGVIGYPVKHSMSPTMHNRAIAALGLDYVYLPFPIAPEHLKTAVDGFAAIGVRGFNITIPHKQAIIPLLDEVSAVAEAIGAVNTVGWSERGWCGTNTDALGFMAPLKSLERDWTQIPTLILGSGGAARAVVAACYQLGCPEIWVAGRSANKLAAFAKSWQTSPLQPNMSVYSMDSLDGLLPQAGLVVNATPVGMAPQDMSPLSLEQIARLPRQAIVYDLIYTPRPTRLLQRAAEIGLTAIDGLEMLVQQGAAALEIWTQKPPPVAVMRQALLERLAHPGG
ncbi:MAG: shikimate dehydrogenase [Cyanobacteria bacterium P01_H01_bin.26]